MIYFTAINVLIVEFPDDSIYYCIAT